MIIRRHSFSIQCFSGAVNCLCHLLLRLRLSGMNDVVRHGAENCLRSRTATSAALLLAGLTLLSAGQANAEAPKAFSIERQKLENAIQLLAMQSGRQVVFAPSTATDRLSPPVIGTMRFNEALDRLLWGSGLKAKENRYHVILIEKAAQRAVPSPEQRSVPIHALEPPITPLIVTAITQDDPASFKGDLVFAPRSTFLTDIAQSTPGIGAQPTGSGQQGIIVRGVGLAGDTTTIVYFGGVPISGPSGTGSDGARTSSDLALIDIESVRSSRTSRSSQHGVGALAGEIEIEPRKPRLGQWEAASTLAASMQKGGDPGFLLSSTINAPSGPDFAVRLTSYAQSQGGYIDNARTGQSNVNGDAIRGVRLMTRYAPLPALDINLMLLWQHRRIADPGTWMRDLGPYRTDRYFSAPTTHDFKMARLDLQYAPGPVALKSITAHYRWRLDRNYDRTNVTLLQATDAAACQRYFSLRMQNCTEDQASQFTEYVTDFTPTLLHIPIVSRRIMQEIRLDQERGGGLNWTVGAIIDRREETASSELSAYQASGAKAELFGARELDIERTQTSAFADISWRTTAGFVASAGLRYDNYDVSSRNDVIVPNVISGSLTSWPTATVRTNGFHARLHVDVPLSSAITFHAQMNRSFRPGGANTASVLLPDRYTYGSDTLWGLEIGAKFRLGEKTELTITAYSNDWQDMQYRAMSENRSHAYLVNVGNAAIRGLEAQFITTPTQGLTARLDGSFIRGKLNRVTEAAELVGSAGVGDRIPFVPALRLRAGVERKWRLSEDDSVSLDANWQRQSGFWSTFSRDDPDFLSTKGFHVTNAALRYEASRTSLCLCVKNIFDRVANLRAVTTGYGVGQSFSIGPREVSLSWSRRW